MELVVIIALFIVLPLVSVVCTVLDGIHSGHSRWKIIINGVLCLLFFLAFYLIAGRVFLNSFCSYQKHIKQLDKVFEQEYSSVYETQQDKHRHRLFSRGDTVLTSACRRIR